MAGSRFKVENGLLVKGTSTNSVFEHQVAVNANLTVTADLLYVGGNLYVTGNQIIAGQTIYATDILPSTATGLFIGNTTHRFDGLFRNLEASGNLHPQSNGLLFGNTTRRWDTYSSNVNASGSMTVGANALFQSTVNISGNLNVTGNTNGGNINSGNTTITGFINVSTTANVAGNLQIGGVSTLTGNVTSTGNVQSKGFILDNAAFFSNTKSVTTTSVTVIDSFPKAYSNFCKMFITVQSGSLYHSIDMNSIHDGTNILVTKYGEIYNTKMGTFDANINGANVEITFQASGAGTYTVKSTRQQTLA